ncbi:GtrA family protein [Pseudomonadota bacterium]
MIRNFISKQFLKFLFVGVTAALANWLTRYWLSRSLSFQAAVALAYLVGMAVAYWLNRVFVFPGSNRPMPRQASEFVLVNLAFFPIVWASAVFFRWVLNGLGLEVYVEGIAHALALAIPMLFTFLIYKFKTFRAI